jgi:hypothetical protein
VCLSQKHQIHTFCLLLRVKPIWLILPVDYSFSTFSVYFFLLVLDPVWVDSDNLLSRMISFIYLYCTFNTLYHAEEQREAQHHYGNPEGVPPLTLPSIVKPLPPPCWICFIERLFENDKLLSPILVIIYLASLQLPVSDSLLIQLLTGRSIGGSLLKPLGKLPVRFREE